MTQCQAPWKFKNIWDSMEKIVNMKFFSLPFTFQVFSKLTVPWSHLKNRNKKSWRAWRLCVGEQGFSVVQTLPIEWLFFVLVTLYWSFKCPTISYILIALLSNEINLKVSCSRRQWHHNWQMVIKSLNLLIDVCADWDIDVIALRQTDSSKLSGSTCVCRISAWQGQMLT